MAGEKGRFIDHQIGAYTARRLIGKGGMGEVYVATSNRPDELVAVKFLLGNSPQAVSEFAQEAEALRKLHHPNIVRLFGTGIYEPTQSPYIVMEYFPQGSVEDVIKRRGMLQPESITTTMMHLSEALSYSHGKKILHRDIKGANILVGEQRGSGEAVNILSDFGITATAHTLLTQSTVSGKQGASGTYTHMAPEQFHGRAIIPSDIYAAGITLYKLLTGDVPFKGEDWTAFNYFNAHLNTLPLDPTVVRSKKGLPGSEEADALARIVEKALKKDPKDRYQNAGEMKTAIKEESQRAREKASRDVFYSIAGELRARNIDPQKIIDTSLPLDRQVIQLQNMLLQQVQQELLQYHEQNQSLRNDKATLEGVNAGLVDNVQRVLSTNQRLERANKTLTAESEELKQQNNGLKESNKILTKQNDELTKAVQNERRQQMQKEELLKREITSLETIRSSQSKEIQELKGQLEKLSKQATAKPQAVPDSQSLTKVEPQHKEIHPTEQTSSEALALSVIQGKYEEAIEACNQAIRINPKNSHAYHDKGFALHELGRHEEAEQAHQRARELEAEQKTAEMNH